MLYNSIQPNSDTKYLELASDSTGQRTRSSTDCTFFRRQPQVGSPGYPYPCPANYKFGVFHNYVEFFFHSIIYYNMAQSSLKILYLSYNFYKGYNSGITRWSRYIRQRRGVKRWCRASGLSPFGIWTHYPPSTSSVHQPGSSPEFYTQVFLYWVSLHRHGWSHHLATCLNSVLARAEISNPLNMWLVFLVTSPHLEANWGPVICHPMVQTLSLRTFQRFLKLCARNWGQSPESFFII